MNKIILVTGGARSGKSTFAENEVRKLGKKTAYLATAIAFDDGMKARIQKHINQRPSEWSTFEKPTGTHEVIGEIAKEHEVLLLDCITVLVSNTLFMDHYDWDRISEEQVDAVEARVFGDIKLLVEAIKKTEMTVYLVTNELGSGIVPENRLARIFRDMAGRINQYLASEANDVFVTVSGMPLQLKG